MPMLEDQKFGQHDFLSLEPPFFELLFSLLNKFGNLYQMLS